MSETIREYESIKGNGLSGQDMSITAFVGGGSFGKAVQISVGSQCCHLSESQQLDLIAVLCKRMNVREGYSATGYTNLVKVRPSGEMILKQED